MPNTTNASLPSPSPAKRTVILFAVFDHDEVTDDVLWNGTSGFLLHSDDHPKVMDAIAGIGRDGNSPNPRSVRPIMVHMRPEPTKNGLSPREKEVLNRMVEGLSYKMIADVLGISFETVRSHIKRIYEKLQVHNNTEAVAKTLKCGLLG